ncbi:hypothetical protein JCM10908_007279 [Rhodotorula pacifica]|uniref:uncharacterized protein n=1 Tax=Rhodotorula pacifica TaxID=1495444 RepID=UPI00317245AD
MQRKHVCILPREVPLEASEPSSSSSRFLRLPHPRTHQPALFLPYARTGGFARSPDAVLEVQRISPDADKQRCWFIDQEVASDGSIAMFTPFDPAFFAISYLSSLPPHYQTYADLWDAVSQKPFEPLGEQTTGASEAADLFSEDLSRLGQMQAIRQRICAVCEEQPAAAAAADEQPLLRYSPTKTLALLRSKVDALASPEGGIFGPLESTEPGEERKPLAAAQLEQNAVASAFSSAKRGLGKEDVGSGHGLSADIQTESRQKYAIGIIANYLPPAVTKQLLAAYDFPALTAYLSLTTPNSVVLNTTYLPGRGSAKFDSATGEELGGGSAAKKRKAEQSKGSRGVEALKKVNTKGMKSLAELFGKQTAKAASAPSAAATKKGEAKEPPAKKKKVSK